MFKTAEDVSRPNPYTHPASFCLVGLVWFWGFLLLSLLFPTLLPWAYSISPRLWRGSRKPMIGNTRDLGCACDPQEDRRGSSCPNPPSLGSCPAWSPWRAPHAQSMSASWPLCSLSSSKVVTWRDLSLLECFMSGGVHHVLQLIQATWLHPMFTIWLYRWLFFL